MRRGIIILLLCMLVGTAGARLHTSIAQMRVEYQTTPLAVEEKRPRFSWQMVADTKARNCYQKAYAITVTDGLGHVLWHSGKVFDAQSLNVRYAGQELQPQTRYTWQLTVWNQDDIPCSQQSWFETGLVADGHNGDAWQGAKWIGVPEEEMCCMHNIFQCLGSLFRYSWTDVAKPDRRLSCWGQTTSG